MHYQYLQCFSEAFPTSASKATLPIGYGLCRSLALRTPLLLFLLHLDNYVEQHVNGDLFD